LRLRGHDYAATGAYFVTICTHRRECLLGRIVNGNVQLNDVGCIIVSEWVRSASIRPEIDLDAFVVMPNHVHGIIRIESDRCRGARPCAPTDDSRIAARCHRANWESAHNDGRVPIGPDLAGASVRMRP